MGYFEVITGQQSWSDYINNKEQVRGFEKALQKRTGSIERAVKVGLANQRDYQTALESGLGAIRGDISHEVSGLANSMEFGLDNLSKGIDQLKADFNLLMGDVIWKLEVQSNVLASILKTLQAPLDTQAKELRHRAEDAYQNGWYEEALKDFLESEHKNYQDFAVHRSIGNIYLYHLIDLPKALKYFCNASKYARPRDARQAAEAEYFAGVVFSLQHDFEQALAHFGEATGLNSVFYDAFYMHAVSAGMLGDATTATRSLETAIKGDARYHERARTSPVFEKVRLQVHSLLDGLVLEAKEKANSARQSIEGLCSRCDGLLPEDKETMSRLFESAKGQCERANTYKDYLLCLPLFHSVEAELVRAEKHKQSHNEKVKETYEEQKGEALRYLGGSFIGSIIGYLVVSMGGCIARINYELESPLNSYVREGLIVGLAIIVAGFITAIWKRKRAKEQFEAEYHP
jgi:tetratricopeptide (TPR) repeat protein